MKLLGNNIIDSTDTRGEAPIQPVPIQQACAAHKLGR